MPYRLELLGVPVLRNPTGSPEDLPLGKPLALLGYLVAERRPVAREELGRLLWPEATPERRRHSVRQAIWILRRALNEEVIHGDDQVWVPPEAVRCDLEELEEALRTGGIDNARSLWRGPPFSSFSLPESRGWEHWRGEHREALRRRLFEVLLDRGRELVERGNAEDALGYVEEAIGLNLYSLTGRVLQVETLLELGQIPAARQALEETRREIGEMDGAAEELGRLERRLMDL